MAELIKLGEKGKLESATERKESQVAASFHQKVIFDERPTGTLSAVAIWGYCFVMFLPIIGWTAAVIFAFRKSENQNRRNLARATLVNKVILLVFILILYVCIRSMIGNALDTLNRSLTGITEATADISQLKMQFYELRKWISRLAEIF